MLRKHYNLLKKYTNTKTALLEIRTHALWYIKGIPNAKQIKNEIVLCKTEEEFINTLSKIEEIVKNNEY